jgi:hypothetical protein
MRYLFWAQFALVERHSVLGDTISEMNELPRNPGQFLTSEPEPAMVTKCDDFLSQEGR